MCGWITMWECVRGNIIGNAAALSMNVCASVVASRCIYMCVYNSQLRACRCAAAPFWKASPWEAGSLRGWSTAHVHYTCAQLFLFISSQHLCLFCTYSGSMLYSQHVRAGERRSALSQRGKPSRIDNMQRGARPHLMQLHHDGPGFVLLFIFLHFRLQTLVVLQGLLPTFHRHVEAGEDAAVPETNR